jgi:hypothetical protein
MAGSIRGRDVWGIHAEAIAAIAWSILIAVRCCPWVRQLDNCRRPR